MRNLILAVLVVVLVGTRGFVGGARAAETPERLTLVKIENYAKEVEYKILNQAEFKALAGEVAAEAKLKPKIMAAAEKEWKSDAERAKKPFPKAAIADRKITLVAAFTDREKAEKAMSEKEDRESSRRDRTLELRKPAKGEKEDPARIAREAEKEELLSQAREIYTTKVTELLKPAEGAAAEGNAFPTDKPAEKKADGDTKKADDGEKKADKKAP